MPRTIDATSRRSCAAGRSSGRGAKSGAPTESTLAPPSARAYGARIATSTDRDCTYVISRVATSGRPSTAAPRTAAAPRTIWNDDEAPIPTQFGSQRIHQSAAQFAEDFLQVADLYGVSARGCRGDDKRPIRPSPNASRRVTCQQHMAASTSSPRPCTGPRST